MAHHIDICFPDMHHCNGGSLPPPHNIQDGDIYRMWSMVSHMNQSFLKRNSQGQLTLLFDGNVDETDFVNIQAIDVGSGKKKLFRLQFADPNDDNMVYMITGEKQNGKPVVTLKHVNANSKTPNSGKFEAITFYAFTMFRCFSVNGETDLYLASDRDGKVLLINGGVIRYPNPALLFIANQVI